MSSETEVNGTPIERKRLSPSTLSKLYLLSAAMAIIYAAQAIGLIAVTATTESDTTVPVYKQAVTFDSMGEEKIGLSLYTTFNALVPVIIIMVVATIFEALSVWLWDKNIQCFRNYKTQLNDRILNFQHMECIINRSIIVCALATLGGIQIMKTLAVLCAIELAVCIMRFRDDRYLSQLHTQFGWVDTAMLFMPPTLDLVVWVSLLDSASENASVLTPGIQAVEFITFFLFIIENIITPLVYVLPSLVEHYGKFVTVWKILCFLERTIVVWAVVRGLAPSAWLVGL